MNVFIVVDIIGVFGPLSVSLESYLLVLSSRIPEVSVMDDVCTIDGFGGWLDRSSTYF